MFCYVSNLGKQQWYTPQHHRVWLIDIYFYIFGFMFVKSLISYHDLSASFDFAWQKRDWQLNSFQFSVLFHLNYTSPETKEYLKSAGWFRLTSLSFCQRVPDFRVVSIRQLSWQVNLPLPNVSPKKNKGLGKPMGFYRGLVGPVMNWRLWLVVKP